MNCKYCGTEIPGGSVFCPKCGSRINEQPVVNNAGWTMNNTDGPMNNAGGNMLDKAPLLMVREPARQLCIAIMGFIKVPSRIMFFRATVGLNLNRATFMKGTGKMENGMVREPCITVMGGPILVHGRTMSWLVQGNPG